MTLLKQALAILGTVLTIAMIVAIVSPKTAQAVAAALVQIEPGTTTHMGQNESQMVSLSCTNGNLYCNSVGNDGTVSTSAYVVPAGYTLIITDWEFFFPTSPKQAGQTNFDELAVLSTGKVIVFGSALGDANGTYSTHEKYTAGVRVGSGETLVDEDVFNVGGAQAFVQGYLVPN